MAEGRSAMIRTVIFDWDGTLARTLHLWIDGYHAAFARRDLAYGAHEIARHFFAEHHKVAYSHPHLDFPPIAEEARGHVFHGALTVALYDGAREVLAALHARDVVLGLVSSSPRALLERGLEAQGLAGFFASIIAGDDGFGHKPDPLPFEQTLVRLGAAAAETLIIGDSQVDILAGRAVGCRTCWFAPEDNRLFHDFAVVGAMMADHRIGDLGAVLDCVRPGGR